MNEWSYQWMNQSMNQSMNQWINESMNKWINEWMNEAILLVWMNESMNESMNQMNQWMNQWINAYMHDFFLATGTGSKRRFTRMDHVNHLRFLYQTEIYLYVNFYFIPYLRDLFSRGQNLFVWVRTHSIIEYICQFVWPFV